jgi:hypothetical protein
VVGIITTILAVGKITYDWLNKSVKVVASVTDSPTPPAVT